MPQIPPPALSVDALKALAHPLRQRMLTRLRRHGPATSAELAALYRVDRGATSYHLRQLARFGFIREDETLSRGRRKYWRAVPRDIRLPRDPQDPETAAVADEVGRGWMAQAAAELEGYLTTRAVAGEFAQSAMHSFGATWLTARELAEFGEEYIALLNRWHRDPPDDRADEEHAAKPERRPITVVFHAFPTPDEEAIGVGEPARERGTNAAGAGHETRAPGIEAAAERGTNAAGAGHEPGSGAQDRPECDV